MIGEKSHLAVPSGQEGWILLITHQKTNKTFIEFTAHYSFILCYVDAVGLNTLYSPSLYCRIMTLAVDTTHSCIFVSQGYQQVMDGTQ